VSSSYYALCVSHNPAITISADLGRTEADHLTTRDRLTGHNHCDIIIERVSGGVVEMACPGTQLPGPTGCKGTHRDTEWIDVAWLRLLTAATTPTNQIDPALLRRVSARGCWTPNRIATLRAELDMPVPDTAETAEAALNRVWDLADLWERGLTPDQPYARALRAALGIKRIALPSVAVEAPHA
jgi:hypothetical protein